MTNINKLSGNYSLPEEQEAFKPASGLFYDNCYAFQKGFYKEINNLFDNTRKGGSSSNI